MPTEVELFLDKRSQQQLEANLKTLSDKAKKDVLRKGGTAGGGVLLKQMRRDAPFQNRFLRRSLDSRVKIYPSGGVAVIVGQNLNKQAKGIALTKTQRRKGLKPGVGGITGAGNVVPDHLVSGWVKMHRMPGRDRGGYFQENATAKRMRFARGGNVRYATRMRHPGHGPNEFQGVAFAKAHKAAQAAAVKKMRERIDHHVDALPKN